MAAMDGKRNMLSRRCLTDLVDSRPQSNFISDLFFLLNAFQHLGLVKTIATRGRAEKNIAEIEKELKRTEASHGDWTGVRSMTLRPENLNNLAERGSRSPG